MMISEVSVNNNVQTNFKTEEKFDTVLNDAKNNAGYDLGNKDLSNLWELGEVDNYNKQEITEKSSAFLQVLAIPKVIAGILSVTATDVFIVGTGLGLGGLSVAIGKNKNDILNSTANGVELSSSEKTFPKLNNDNQNPGFLGLENDANSANGFLGADLGNSATQFPSTLNQNNSISGMQAGDFNNVGIYLAGEEGFTGKDKEEYLQSFADGYISAAENPNLKPDSTTRNGANPSHAGRIDGAEAAINNPDEAAKILKKVNEERYSLHPVEKSWWQF